MGRTYHEDIRAFVATQGTASQQERMAEGFLDPDEIVAYKRAELYARLSEMPRYINLKDHQVRSYLKVTDGIVVYRVVDKDVVLDAHAHGVLKQVRQLAPVGATFQVRQHVITWTPSTPRAWEVVKDAKPPEPRDLKIPSVLVSLEWAGHPMSREYQLSQKVWL